MAQPDKKKAIIQKFDKAARPGQYFAEGWITVKAKRNEHKIVSDLLDRAGSWHSKRALDVGCGIGGYFDILLDRGLGVVGFDVSRNMIGVCRSKYAERDNVALMLADIEHLPFQPKSFETVLSIDVLVYLDEKSRKVALENLVKLLKAGGVIFVEVKNKACPAYWLKRFRDPLGEKYSIASITSILKNAGCTIEAVKGVLGPAFISPIVVIMAKKSVEE
jgi:2-polyprenyl-3-methyl-5-hydroxy-6-metoxy-1,4-benzoquinol methylase